MNYFPFHIGDYAVHTRHLSLMEDLAYRRLLDLYYTRENGLPGASECARLIGMREHLEEVGNVLGEFFTANGEGWSHARCDEELAKMQLKQENARASVAKRAANASVTQASSKRDASVIEASSTNTNTNTNTKEREPRATRLPAPWSCPNEWLAWAKTERPDLNPDHTASKFADYWHGKPGKDGRKLDWLATWRNWVREERAPRQNPADVARATVANNPALDDTAAYLRQEAEHREAIKAERLRKLAA